MQYPRFPVSSCRDASGDSIEGVVVRQSTGFHGIVRRSATSGVLQLGAQFCGRSSVESSAHLEQLQHSQVRAQLFRGECGSACSFRSCVNPWPNDRCLVRPALPGAC